MLAFNRSLIHVLACARDCSVVYDVYGVQLVFFKPFLTFAKYLIIYDICDVNAPVIKDMVIIFPNPW